MNGKSDLVSLLVEETLLHFFMAHHLTDVLFKPRETNLDCNCLFLFKTTFYSTALE